MGSASNFSPCLLKSVVGNCFFINVPQACSDIVFDNGNWLHKGQKIADEKEMARIKALQIPPAWKNVVVAKDWEAKIQAIGMDKAGRWQYRYSELHMLEAAEKKFKRLKSFSKAMPKIESGIQKGILKQDTEAYLLRLENQTAIRIGTDKDFKAKKKAYGLTTLQKEHVTIDGDVIRLDFVAKEGLPAKYEVKDKILSSWLKERVLKTKGGEKLFPDTNSDKLNKYLKDISGGSYTVKDFRTYHGSRLAKDYLSEYQGKTFSKKEKQQIIKDVSEKVSKFLHNTPDMAKKSYIDPMVWEVIGGL